MTTAALEPRYSPEVARRTADAYARMARTRFAPRFAKSADLGLTPSEFAVLRRLDTPQKIQSFVHYDLRQNFEPHGDTCRPVREVLRERRAPGVGVPGHG